MKRGISLDNWMKNGILIFIIQEIAILVSVRNMIILMNEINNTVLFCLIIMCE